MNDLAHVHVDRGVHDRGGHGHDALEENGSNNHIGDAGLIYRSAANQDGGYRRQGQVVRCVVELIICAIFIPMAGFSPSYLLNEIVTRMGRNLFLVLCLLFPIMAGW